MRPSIDLHRDYDFIKKKLRLGHLSTSKKNKLEYSEIAQYLND